MRGNEEINMADTQESGGMEMKRKQCESFPVDFVQGGGQKESLQDAFLKFQKDKQMVKKEFNRNKKKCVQRKKNQKEIKNQRKMKRKRKKKQRNRQHMQKLRAKFMAQTKKYFGTPYAKRYWTPDDEEYYSKRFLDCCGLVRQVMLDLRKEFGFRIGPWNQAYMYDTLPITIEREEDMKPGDLVFISGIYPNPKSRQQKHNMTHVEIWAGDGCKTIGARWNKGKVQVFDHYKFQPKSFHSEQYIFKSIDTWLAGTCKSHCQEHKWKRRKFNPSKKSVFAMGADKKDKTTNQEKGDQEKTDKQNEEEKASGVVGEGEGHVEGAQWTGEEEGVGAEGSGGEEEEEEDFGQQDEDFDDDDGEDDEEDDDDDDFLYEQGDDSQEDEDDINATPLGLQSQIMSKNSSVASMQNYASLSESTTETSTPTNPSTESIRKTDLAIEVSKCVIVDKNDKNLNNSASSSNADSVFSKATNSMLKGRGSQLSAQQNNQVKELEDYASVDCRQEGQDTTLRDMQDPDMKDAATEKKNEGASGSEPVKPEITDSGKATPNKTETSTGKTEKPAQEKTADSKTTKHDSGLNPVKSDSAKDAKDAKDTKEDSAKERPSKKSSSHTRSTKLPSCSLPVNMQPTFYVGGGNGVSLVEAPLLGLGWKRTNDKYDERFRLKWVECKTRINYGAFKEGEQLVNHIPNGNLLTNKLGLLNSLQEYERVTMSTKGRPPRLRFTDFVPETYRFDEKHDREAFMECYKDNELWICKPTGMNQGKGIFIIRSREELDKLIEEREQRREQLAKSSKPMMTRIVQKYITNPLLLDERKFDIRAYMLIASTTPYLVLYHKGYVRLCCNKYKEDSKELSTHLTNQFVQKKDPNYKDVKEDTAWSMDKFNQYINENVAPHKEIEQDWVYNTLTKQMQKIMIHCFNSVKHKLQSRVGFFDLFGLDFMVDTDLKVYLIEINVNPALHTNCEALKEVIPGVVEETLYVTIECFEKTRKNQQLLPLNSMRNFSILYCGSRPYNMPSRPSRSVSPSKDTSTQEKRSSISNTAAPGAPRSLHRFSTTSTPVVSAPPVSSVSKSTQEKPLAEKVTTEKSTEKSSIEKKQPTVVDVHRVPNPNAKLSDMVSFSSSTLLAEAGNLLGQTTNVLDETVKLKMVHGDEKQPGEDEKLKKEDSNVKEKANSVEKSSEGVVLNLAPPEKQPSVMVEKSNKTSTADAQPVTSNTKTTSSTSSTSNTKPKPFVGRVAANTSTTSAPATSSLSSTTKSSPGDFNSSATTSKPGLTEITPKPAYPYVIATSTTSTNDIASKNVSNFPLITNNGNTSKSARHSSLSQSLRRDTSGKVSNSGGLSSNPYSLSSSLGKPHGSAVYLNTATSRSLNVTGSNALSTANSHSNSAKIMTVPSITISEPGPKTIATLTLTSSRAGFLGRSDVRSGLRRSRDRDKPDRGN